MAAPHVIPFADPDPRRRVEAWTPGFTDPFGERFLTFDRATATSFELLRLKRDLSGPAVEQALRDRLLGSHVQDQSIASIRGVERWDGDLLLVSRHITGRRLSDSLRDY